MQFKSFKFSLFEFGGSFGDLGTLLPLAVALISVNRLDTTSVFFVVGLAYITSGLYYRIPMPVQPLKAVAAIALTTGLSASVISTSGLVMGIILLFLAITGLIGIISRLFSRPIIRGIQLGVGLLLLKSGFSLANKPQVLIGGESNSLALGSITIPMGWIIAVVSAALLVFFLRNKLMPASIALFIFGIGVGGLWGSFGELRSLTFGLTLPSFELPSTSALATALVFLVIPQLPLTLGNAVFASASTAKSYFGTQAKRVTPKALLTSMGLSNISAGLLGGMPICHGSGGITAHYRLGARTGACGLIIGALCIVIALFVDGNAMPLFSMIPYSVLGALLVFVGLQHALLMRDLRDRQEIVVAIIIAVIGLATANLAIGFTTGMALLHGRRLIGLFQNRYCSRSVD